MLNSKILNSYLLSRKNCAHCNVTYSYLKNKHGGQFAVLAELFEELQSVKKSIFQDLSSDKNVFCFWAVLYFTVYEYFTFLPP